MRTLEIAAIEPSLGPVTVEFLALRRNSESHVLSLRRSVPVDLAGIIAEVPGAELEFGMSCSADGIVVLELTADAGGATDLVVGELVAVLHPVADTAVRAVSSDPLSVRWPVVSDGRRGRLGFSADGAVDPQISCTGHRPPESSTPMSCSKSWLASRGKASARALRRPMRPRASGRHS